MGSWGYNVGCDGPSSAHIPSGTSGRRWLTCRGPGGWRLRTRCSGTPSIRVEDDRRAGEGVMGADTASMHVPSAVPVAEFNRSCVRSTPVPVITICGMWHSGHFTSTRRPLRAKDALRSGFVVRHVTPSCSRAANGSSRMARIASPRHQPLGAHPRSTISTTNRMRTGAVVISSRGRHLRLLYLRVAYVGSPRG